MSLNFEWDPGKAGANLAKHGVSFEEASTLFGDAQASTIPDPVHSLVERRFITIGISHQQRILVAVHTDRGNNIRLISARCASRKGGVNMKKQPVKVPDSDVLDGYDFSRGVRGKYARRHAEGANVVLLEPDVAKAFPTAQAVNRSLRTLLGRRRPVAARAR